MKLIEFMVCINDILCGREANYKDFMVDIVRCKYVMLYNKIQYNIWKGIKAANYNSSV